MSSKTYSTNVLADTLMDAKKIGWLGNRERVGFCPGRCGIGAKSCQNIPTKFNSVHWGLIKSCKIKYSKIKPGFAF